MEDEFKPALLKDPSEFTGIKPDPGVVKRTADAEKRAFDRLGIVKNPNAKPAPLKRFTPKASPKR